MKLFLLLLAVGLAGCSFTVGRHPDNQYRRAYCYPCLESPGNFGIGIRYSPYWLHDWYQDIDFGWVYE